VKNKLVIGLVVLVIVIVCYAFRYEFLLKIQYSSIKSIKCPGKENCQKKLWVHRVNSIERYKYLENKFSGFETDIVFNNNSGKFLVYHPTIAQKDTITLDSFLVNANLTAKRFWMDTRGVDSSNANESLESLANLPSPSRIKSACIFELYDVKAAEMFAKKGYTVSLNLFEDLKRQLLSGKMAIDSLNKKLAMVKYVSQESDQQKVLQALFPRKKSIIWHLRYMDTFQTDTIEKLLMNPQIDIILINVKTP